MLNSSCQLQQFQGNLSIKIVKILKLILKMPFHSNIMRVKRSYTIYNSGMFN